MKYPIQKIWAQDSTNKLNLTESQIANGIAYQGAVVSNQLNGIANRADLVCDEIQRYAGFFDNRKTYTKNDLCKLLVNYNGKRGIVTLIYVGNTQSSNAPFVTKQSGVLDFSYNQSSGVTFFTITTQDKAGFFLKDYVNGVFWEIVSYGALENEIRRVGTSESIAEVLFEAPYTWLYGVNKKATIITNKSIFNYDEIYFLHCYYQVWNEFQANAPFSPAFIRMCHKHQIRASVFSSSAHIGSADNGDVAFDDFENWRFGNNSTEIIVRGSTSGNNTQPQNLSFQLWGFKY